MIDFLKLQKGTAVISVIGMGYVGLPLAIELSKKYKVIGFDIDENKIDLLKKGIDPTQEVGSQELLISDITFTYREEEISLCTIHIVCVPTPINPDKTPNLIPIVEASKTVGRNLNKNALVIFESTVYPGTTEEICVPLIEQESGFKFGLDFEVGYSPERINPGDKIHRLTNISKVVSASSTMSVEVMKKLYGSIIAAEIYVAPSIKVAEAAKVIENSQRDINIAFMNELSIIFEKMNISTHEVLKAAKTKWNFMDFKPGLVGGHCIGVDPYYFIYKANQLGYHSQIIASGRKVNDGMGSHIATRVIKKMINANIPVKNSVVAIIGLAFKENCSDIRNSKVIDIIKELKEYGVKSIISDPLVSNQEAKQEYNVDLVELNEICEVDAIILAVPHKEVLEKCDIAYYSTVLKRKDKLIIDLKSSLNQQLYEENGFEYWSL
ncbi:nucleotide sugar dehydrogenase [Saccharibacillus sp. JS10]|uniref:nucleotide sugar dehydrogenase n=1 Tax=Saccharibacillus sp. JS10 TaxID=2950552 RepID=UPI00210A2212|nr:nucleotide sugar dehydrogenase [Saccharibacillus sp. JS10]MCQ4088805.1 nucleotide sugar dehydrogenase [Saccharibacillus sp. JS10]